MSWQRSYRCRVPLTKQLKGDSVGHGEATINNVATVANVFSNYLHNIYRHQRLIDGRSNDFKTNENPHFVIYLEQTKPQSY